MKVVDGLDDARVNAAIEAASESKEDSIVRDGRHIRGCSMINAIWFDREVMAEASKRDCGGYYVGINDGRQELDSVKCASLIEPKSTRDCV
jgi:hypothetical protein